MVWLSGMSGGLRTERSLVRFPVRAHACVVGQVLSRGQTKGNHTLMFFSLFLPLPLSKNKERKSYKKTGSGRWRTVVSCVSCMNYTRCEHWESTIFHPSFTEPLSLQLFLFLSFCCLPGNYSPRGPASGSARENCQCRDILHDSFKCLNGKGEQKVASLFSVEQHFNHSVQA